MNSLNKIQLLKFTISIKIVVLLLFFTSVSLTAATNFNDDAQLIILDTFSVQDDQIDVSSNEPYDIYVLEDNGNGPKWGLNPFNRMFYYPVG